MILIPAILLLLYAYALKAGVGGLTATDPSRWAPMQEASGVTTPQALERGVAAGQLGATLFSALGAAILGSRILDTWGWAGFVGFLLVTVPVAYPGFEILPLLYAIPRGRRRFMIGIMAIRFPAVALPLQWLRAAFKWIIEGIIPGAGPNASRVMAVRREALAVLSEEAQEARRLRRAQRQLVTQVFEFSESSVGEVMVPRNAVQGIPAAATVGDAVAAAEEHQFSRYPVYRDNLDQVEGVIHIFDLLSATDLSSPLKPYVRPILYAPEGKKCDELLSELRVGHQHAAIVVDEFGGTAGWVTVEDLLEELVGEIKDEHDEDVEMVRALGRRVYMVDARIRVDDLNRLLHLEIPEGDYETLAGYLLEEMERIPKRGDAQMLDGCRFEIAQADARRILRVKVEVGE
jgi:CBS domain containing-hemolysin-like protein